VTLTFVLLDAPLGYTRAPEDHHIHPGTKLW